MLKGKSVTMIDMEEWDDLVQKTYGRVYNFQQQDGCKPRGVHHFSVPDDTSDYENDTVPEEVNHYDMGVSFKAWLERDPNQKLPNEEQDYTRDMWWNRNFYPDVSMIIQDLYEKGLIEKGNYAIEIDW